MKQIVGKKLVGLSVVDLKNLAGHYQSLIFDLGCGDGKFAYRLAKSQPEALVVAVDANKNALEKISFKSSRKPAKGGLENVVYVWSAVETLPEELVDLAAQVYVNLPWGSLLEGVVNANPEFMDNISRMLKSNASLQVVFSYHHDLEPEVVEKYGFDPINEPLVYKLKQKYAQFNLDLQEWGLVAGASDVDLDLTWLKQLRSDRNRPILMTKWTKK